MKTYKAKHKLKYFLLLEGVHFSQSINYLIGKQKFLTPDGQVHGQARTTCNVITNYIVGFYMLSERILTSMIPTKLYEQDKNKFGQSINIP